MKIILMFEEYLRNESRNKFYSDKKTLSDLETDTAEICLRNNIPTPLYIQEKIKLCEEYFPGYVIWTPLSIIGRLEEAKRIIYFPYSVSSNGEVYSHTKRKELKIGFDKLSKYWTISPLGKKQYIQRIMMSSFGFDQHSDTFEVNKLTVNHKDHIRFNNELSNLEWMSLKDNLKDMQDFIGEQHTYFPKPVKLITNKNIDNIPKGSVFYIKDRKTLERYGAFGPSIRNAISKGITMYGCYFETIPVEGSSELDFSFPEELKSHFSRKSRKKLIQV